MKKGHKKNIFFNPDWICIPLIILSTLLFILPICYETIYKEFIPVYDNNFGFILTSYLTTVYVFGWLEIFQTNLNTFENKHEQYHKYMRGINSFTLAGKTSISYISLITAISPSIVNFCINLNNNLLLFLTFVIYFGIALLLMFGSICMENSELNNKILLWKHRKLIKDIRKSIKSSNKNDKIYSLFVNILQNQKAIKGIHRDKFYKRNKDLKDIDRLLNQINNIYK